MLDSSNSFQSKKKEKQNKTKALKKTSKNFFPYFITAFF